MLFYKISQFSICQILQSDYTLIITLIYETLLYQISQFSISILKEDFKQKHPLLAWQPKEEEGKLQHFELVPTRLLGERKKSHGG